MKRTLALKKSLSLTLAFLLVLSLLAVLPFTASAADPTPTDGWAAVDGVWTISNVNDMMAFQAKIKDYYTFENETVKLTTDIDLSGIEWTGYKANSSSNNTTFNGTLDGQGHKISNLTIQNATTGNLGFVLFLGNCTIRNIAFVNGNVNASTGNTCGILAAQVMNGKAATLENVYVSGSVTAPDKNRNMIGGVVGIARGSFSATNCVFDVDVTGQKGVGAILGAQNNTGIATFIDCASYGSVSIDNSMYRASGGFIGILSGNASFTRCVSAATLSDPKRIADAFFCLDRTNCNFAATLATDPTVTLTDCYAVYDIADRYAIGAYNAEGESRTVFNVNISYTDPVSNVNYEGSTLVNHLTDLKTCLTSMVDPSNAAFRLEDYAPLASWAMIDGKIIPSAYAKAFGLCPVSETLGYQVAVEENADGTKDIRLVAEVGDLNYANIGFQLTIARDNGTSAQTTISGTKVYQSIQALGETVNATEGKYIVALVLKNVDYATYAHTITVKGFVTLLDETTVLSTASHEFVLAKKA